MAKDNMGEILQRAIFNPSPENSRAFDEMMFKEIARAVYPCGCEKHYARGTSSIRLCYEHDHKRPTLCPLDWMPAGKQYDLENIEQGANEGLYVIWCPVPIMPKRRSTDKK